MSFGRHACRHALKPPTTSTLENPWVSDDLLAATFFRFVNGQRRHGSCVPGPLEARRRLARRRNTALAGIGGPPVEDIACLFGRNGREHMKWTDHPWQRPHSQALATNDTSLPFYDHNPDPIDSRIPESRIPTSVNVNRNKPSTESRLRHFLCGKRWGIEDARDFARRLGIDLQRKPKYSRQIFDSLLKRSTTDFTEAVRFLDDPFLNTRGSGNYLAAVELFARTQAKRSPRVAVLDAIARALELGLVPSTELCSIVKAIPNILVGKNKPLGRSDPGALRAHYRLLWKAIGRCNILGYRDLDKDVVDAWLKELKSVGKIRLASDIIVATHGPGWDHYWPSTFLLDWLETVEEFDSPKPNSFEFPRTILTQIDPDCAVKCLIDVTERLVSNRQTKSDNNKDLLKWQYCLQGLSANASTIGSSQTWSDLPHAYMHNHQEALDAFPSSDGLPVQHQVVMRLWILKSLSRSLGPVTQRIKSTDQPIYLLLNLYETVSQTTGSFLADFLRDIHGLNMPYNGLLLLANDLKLRKLINNTTHQTLINLETSKISLEDTWNNRDICNTTRRFLQGAFEQMFRQMDLTDPQFMNECLRFARLGDSESISSIIRLLDSHTSFKLSLNKASIPIPHPDEMVLVRYHPAPRESWCPDPYVAAEFIHQLAVAASCSQHLAPNRSFHIVQWLYRYLRRYGGPVYPSLVRAMYHAGVVRYRREGHRMSETQQAYIMWIIRKFEADKVVKQMNKAL
ncbi:hypothetical protein N7478_003072 [Penicillium angulare]|uniref:uncharacterized protein n=1 Tax=Penicillium angulare TaxID=116970 RepID=UPI002541CF50|nr:uncharacterized protein N7478_003072 [Penicillium angulare]KAJ5287386.1 hypothetical protein N7478_003072 [Penicillium angulare]